MELFRKHWLLVILAALVFAGNNAAGYMATGGFIPSYATSPTAVGLERTDVLLAVTFGAAIWLIFTTIAGDPGRQNRPQAHLPDRVQRPGC